VEIRKAATATGEEATAIGEEAGLADTEAVNPVNLGLERTGLAAAAVMINGLVQDGTEQVVHALTLMLPLVGEVAPLGQVIPLLLGDLQHLESLERAES